MNQSHPHTPQPSAYDWSSKPSTTPFRVLFRYRMSSANWAQPTHPLSFVPSPSSRKKGCCTLSTMVLAYKNTVSAIAPTTIIIADISILPAHSATRPSASPRYPFPRFLSLKALKLRSRSTSSKAFVRHVAKKRIQPIHLRKSSD